MNYVYCCQSAYCSPRKKRHVAFPIGFQGITTTPTAAIRKSPCLQHEHLFITLRLYPINVVIYENRK